MSKELRIESGIEIPDQRRGPIKGPMATAFGKLKVGQSIFCQAAYYNIRMHAVRYIGVGKYAIRPENGGYRVWRKA